MKRRLLFLFLSLPIALLVAVAITYVGAFGGSIIPWRSILGIAAGAAVIAGPQLLSPRRGWALAAVILLGTIVFWAMQTPSNERDWAEQASRTAYATLENDQLTIHNVRNFRYSDHGIEQESWEDRTYQLRDLQQAYFILTTFGGVAGVGHVMVSFRFGADEFLILSVEIRREKGEEFDPVGGIFRQFELYYVAADERDALALRTNIHKDPTWVIPVNAGPEKTREFFLDMVNRMTDLHKNPQWYNTIFSSCSSNLASHYEVINEVKLPPDHRILLPGFSAELLEELDLLPEGMNAEEAMNHFRVDEKARQLPLDENFSRTIRAHLK